MHASKHLTTCLAAFAALIGSNLRIGTADDRAELDFLLQGILHRVEKLQSAEFTAIGSKVVTGAAPADIPQGEIRLHGAIEDGKLRFDYRQPAMVLGRRELTTQITSGEKLSPGKAATLGPEASISPKDQPQELTTAIIETFYLKTPAKVAYWFNGQPTMFLEAPNATIPTSIRRFDINALGMYGPLEFNRGDAARVLVENYLITPNSDASHLGNGIYAVRFTFDTVATSTTWQFTVDSENGFTTTGSKMIAHSKQAGTEEVLHTTNVTWRNFGEAWLPDKVDKIDFHNGGTSKLTLDFNYSSVNQPLDPALFNEQSFPLPGYAAVIDNSGPNPIVARPPNKHLMRSNSLTERSGLLPILAGTVLAIATVSLVSMLLRRSTRA